MKKLIFMLLVVFAFVANADAQGWLGRLKDKAVDAAKRTGERKVEKEVDDAMNGKSSKKGGKSSKSNDSDYDDAEAGDDPQNTEAEYEQSDFVPGNAVFFEDNLQNEQMGEFPSKWDLLEGNAEVANIKGKKCIHVYPGTRIEPLMTDQKSYLTDVFTMEFDFWMNDPATDLDTYYWMRFMGADKRKGIPQCVSRCRDIPTTKVQTP